MILTLEQLKDEYIHPIVLTMLKGNDDVEERAKVLTTTILEIIDQDRKSHKGESI